MTAAIDQTLEQREIRSQELASFYRWMLTVAIIFTALLWATYGALGLIAVRNTAIMASAFILAHAPIVALLRRRQTELAVFLTCIAMLLLGPIATLILPNLYGMQTMMPLIAAALAIQQLSQRLLRPILLLCWVTIGALPILGRALPADRSIDPLVLAVIEVGAFAVASGLVVLLLWQHYARLSQTVATLQATNDSLGQARATLASEVEARTADLQAALRDVQQRADAQARLLAEVEQQRTTIRDLTMPVIPIDEQTVVMPLVGSFDGQRLADVQEQALATIERLRTRVLILDITGVPVVDTHVAQGLVAVVSAARLLGAQTVLVGVRPEVAQSIVGLGLQLGDLQTERSLQMALLRRG